MPDGCKGMIEYHPRSCPSHDHPYSFLHFRTVAMCGAFLAGGLILTVTASVQSVVGIIQQFPAVRAQLVMSFILPAIQAYHLLHHRLFFLYAFVWHHNIKRLYVDIPPKKSACGFLRGMPYLYFFSMFLNAPCTDIVPSPLYDSLTSHHLHTAIYHI